MNAPISVNNYY